MGGQKSGEFHANNTETIFPNIVFNVVPCQWPGRYVRVISQSNKLMNEALPTSHVSQVSRYLGIGFMVEHKMEPQTMQF